MPLPTTLTHAATRASRASSFVRSLAIGVGVCFVVAVFLSVTFDEPFGRTLVFSLCIGLSCQLLIDGGRKLIALWLSRNEPTPVDWPGWRWMLPLVLVGSWGGVQFGYVLAGRLLGLAVRSPGLDTPRMLFILLAISVTAALGVMSHMLARERLASSHARAEAAQRAAVEAQLRLLESQLEPHMLFNTLANLRVLIALDAPRAQAMLDHLIAFLRATLNASRAGMHPLSAEFERLSDYLALMTVRMGPRLAIALDLPAALRDTPVPPLLLQPLVENCIQHGLEPQVSGGRVEVSAAREGDRLVLRVRDNGVGLAEPHNPTGTRFGLEQVRRRLAALYGPAATLALQAGAGGGTEACISFPISPAK